MSTTQAPVQAALGRIAEFNVSSEATPNGMTPGGQNTKESFPSMYWRQPDGTVCIQPSWPTEAAYLYERGFQQLAQFGKFFKKNPDGWDSTREPWRRIFAMHGESVFPVEQVIEHGWHRKPPYEDAVFPQLRKIENGKWEILVGERKGEIVEDVVCSICRRPFNSDQNRTAHETVAHKETSSHNAMGRAIAEAQSQAVSQGLGGPLAEAIKLLAQGQQQLGALVEQLANRIDQVAPDAAPADKEPAKKAA